MQVKTYLIIWLILFMCWLCIRVIRYYLLAKGSYKTLVALKIAQDILALFLFLLGVAQAYTLTHIFLTHIN